MAEPVPPDFIVRTIAAMNPLEEGRSVFAWLTQRTNHLARIVNTQQAVIDELTKRIKKLEQITDDPNKDAPPSKHSRTEASPPPAD